MDSYSKLVFQILRRKVERLQPVGLNPQDRVKRGDGSSLDVLDVVLASVTVGDAAAALDDAIRERPWERWACPRTSCDRTGGQIRCGPQARAGSRCRS